MPRIKEIEIFHKDKQHKFIAWFTEKDNFHLKPPLNFEMMDRVRGILKENKRYNYKPGTAESLDKLRKQLQEFVELYWQAVETSKRVILISASMSDKVMKNFKVEAWSSRDEEEEPFYHETDTGYRNELYKSARLKENNYGHNNELKLELEWTVADMVDGAEKSIIELKRNEKGDWVKCGNTFTINKHTKSKYVIIDYTEEREQFFLKLEEQFKAMADKVAAFIVQSDEQVAALIDSKQPALL